MPAETQINSSDSADDRLPITRILRLIGEALLYLILVLTPWAFGGVDPEWQFVIAAAVGLLACLWLTRCAIYRRLTIRPDGVTLGLGGLLCLTAFQLVPLPIAVVSILSPSRAESYRSLVPESLERIGSEAVPEGRPTAIPLTVDPELTRHFLADVLLVLLVYVIARNWLASRRSFRRLAIVAVANGVALALYSFSQMLMSDGRIYWKFQAPTSFGPFVCRNHYPFYAYFCLGAAVGLLLNLAKTEYSTVTGKGWVRAYHSVVAWFGNVTQHVGAVLLLVAATIIAVSIPFSLSRGGMLTLLTAGLFVGAVATSVVGQRARGGMLGAGVIAALALALGTWVGWGPIEQRLQSTVSEGRSADNRSEIWTSAVKLAIRNPLLGTGANTFMRVEPATRLDTYDSARVNFMVVNDSVHNEYLEALAEGGIVRFFLTVIIVVSAVGAPVRAYRRLHARTAGPVVLGMVFGLFAVAFHSVFDFGIHIPAVALLAAAVAAYAQAAATDSEFHPTKRMKSSSSETLRSEDMSEGERLTRASSMSLMGPPALAACAVIVIGLGLVVRQYRIWDRGERFGAAAVAVEKENKGNYETRIGLLHARCGLEPGNAEAQAALARAHFDAVLGRLPNKTTVIEKSTVPQYLVDDHIVPALRASRAARAASPHYPVPHMRFAMYCDFCESADPARTYFERVLRLVPFDVEAWYAAGAEAFESSDLKTALQDWKRSLSLGGRQLGPILDLAKRKLNPAQINQDLLPDDPAIVLAAANALFPNHESQKALRLPFLNRVREAARKLPRPTSASLEALAHAEYELGSRVEALTAWNQAVDLSPGDVGLRQRYAKWLEEEELYDLLVMQLEWLRSRNAGGANIIDKLDAARHAVDLKHRFDR